MIIVLDTNDLVSALLKRISIPGKILDAILDGKLRIAVDTDGSFSCIYY